MDSLQVFIDEKNRFKHFLEDSVPTAASFKQAIRPIEAALNQQAAAEEVCVCVCVCACVYVCVRIRMRVCVFV